MEAATLLGSLTLCLRWTCILTEYWRPLGWMGLSPLMELCACGELVLIP